MKHIIQAIFFLLVTITLSGCGLVEGVFKAGVIFALFIVALIGLLIWLLSFKKTLFNSKKLS